MTDAVTGAAAPTTPARTTQRRRSAWCAADVDLDDGCGRTGFFSPNTFNNYQSQYGQFFMGWCVPRRPRPSSVPCRYANSLISHGDAVLSLANGALHLLGRTHFISSHWQRCSTPLSRSRARLPACTGGMCPALPAPHVTQGRYFDPSHAAELTAGYFNTDNNNGYTAIAQAGELPRIWRLTRGRCSPSTAPSLTSRVWRCLTTSSPPTASAAPSSSCSRQLQSPHLAAAHRLQTKASAGAAGIPYSGENALARYDSLAYSTIEAQAQALGFLIQVPA